MAQAAAVTEGRREDRKAIIFAFIAVISWSLGAYFCCALLEMPALQLSAVAMLLGSISAFVYERKCPTLPRMFSVFKTRLPMLCLLVCNQLSYVTAFRMAPAAHVDLINYLWPMMLVVGESFRRNERLTSWQLLGICVCFVGLITLFSEDLLAESIHRGYVLGYCVTLIAALSWTVYSIFGRDADPEHSISEDIFLVGVVLTVVNTAVGSWVVPQGIHLFILSIYSVLCYGLAFPLWHQALKLGHFVTIGSLGNIIPILSVAWLVVGGIVAFSHGLWIATVMVTIGCSMLSQSEEEEVGLELV